MGDAWIHEDIDVGGVRLHYHRTGLGGKRPIVLTHGFTDDGLCWIPVARALQGEYDVIMPDMRGHGRSARVKPGERVDMGADLAGLVRALGLKDPILCGHSMGAMTTFQAAARFPGIASAVILEDPPWWMEPWPVGSPRIFDNPFVDWARSLSALSLESLTESCAKDHPAWPQDLVRAMCESKKAMDPNIVDAMAPRMNAAEGHWTTLLGTLACPTLVIRADSALGGIVTPEVAEKIRELNPRVRVVKIEGVGHLVRFDAFEAFMKTLRAFLDGLD